MIMAQRVYRCISSDIGAGTVCSAELPKPVVILLGYLISNSQVVRRLKWTGKTMVEN